MISANSDDVYVEEATKSGERGYLLKQTCADSVLGDTGSRKREHLFQPVDSQPSSQSEWEKQID